jgi:hypothetical protein
VNEGAATTAIEKVASVINLIIVEFMPISCSCAIGHDPSLTPVGSQHSWRALHGHETGLRQ